MLRITCNCGKSYKVDEEYMGTTVKCKVCGDNILVSDQITSKDEIGEDGSSPNIRIVMIGIILFILIAGGLGTFIFIQSRNEKKMLARCEELHLAAQELWGQQDYSAASELYTTLVNETLDVTSNSSFTYYIDDANSRIKEADEILFAKKHLSDIKTKYQEALNLFMANDMNEAAKVFNQVIYFINKNQKQQDKYFSGIYKDSTNKNKLISDIDDVLSNPDNYQKQSQKDTNQQMDSILSRLSGFKDPTNEIQDLISRFSKIKILTNVYYNMKAEQAKLAKIEHLKQIDLEKQRQLELAKAEKQRIIHEENKKKEQARLQAEREEAKKLFESDPAESYSKFVKNFMQNMLLYYVVKDNIYEEYKYNLEKTSSMINPLVGSLVYYDFINGADGSRMLSNENRILFVPKNGKWVITSIKYRLILYEIHSWEESTVKHTGLIMDVYNRTPNP